MNQGRVVKFGTMDYRIEVRQSDIVLRGDLASRMDEFASMRMDNPKKGVIEWHYEKRHHGAAATSFLRANHCPFQYFGHANVLIDKFNDYDGDA